MSNTAIDGDVYIHNVPSAVEHQNNKIQIAKRKLDIFTNFTNQINFTAHNMHFHRCEWKIR